MIAFANDVIISYDRTSYARQDSSAEQGGGRSWVFDRDPIANLCD
ncbi:MAG TPA: hypothetical protein VK192_00150 [Sphingomicrobium sp.]|nr:hypothetical protein [Sphingomicrobium sp.]